jgi:hydrogenase/urease accessory protein HupE
MNPRNALQRAAIALASAGALAAYGHPNHADAGANTTFLHLLTEPDHLLMIVAAVAVGLWAARRRHAARKQRRD